MGEPPDTATAHPCARSKSPLAIVKPRVLLLLVFAGLAGFVLATTRTGATWEMLAWLLFGGMLATASANIFNNILDRQRDSLMERTMWRPLPSGVMTTRQAAALGLVLGFLGLAFMYLGLNPLTATLTLVGMLYYIIVYTMVLKPRTYENITIGGVAGAFPPLVGWTAVTGELDWPPLYLGLLIVLWTPPHFWSLALIHREDYRRAGVPMLPVVKGEVETRRRIAGYSFALAVAACLFILWDELSDVVYLLGAIGLSLPMLVLAYMVVSEGRPWAPRALFQYSNLYLLVLMALVMVVATRSDIGS